MPKNLQVGDVIRLTLGILDSPSIHEWVKNNGDLMLVEAAVLNDDFKHTDLWMCELRSLSTGDKMPWTPGNDKFLLYEEEFTVDVFLTAVHRRRRSSHAKPAAR